MKSTFGPPESDFPGAAHDRLTLRHPQGLIDPVANHFFLPDARLIGDVATYQLVSDAYEHIPYFPSGTIAFNLSDASIILDGRNYTGSCLFCMAADPAMQLLEKSEGEIAIVVLRPGGFYRLFGLDGAEHGGRIHEVDHDNFPEIIAILKALAAAPPMIEGRVTALNRSFLELARTAAPRGIGDKFLFVAHYTKGNILVGDAAERLGVSARTLERDCLRRFGRTPKRLLRGCRIFHAMAPYQAQGGPIRWDALDPEANYCDQSHFLREHRALGGLSPTEMHKLMSGRSDELVFHSRADLSICGDRDDHRIAVEYDENERFDGYGLQFARELGLCD